MNRSPLDGVAFTDGKNAHREANSSKVGFLETGAARLDRYDVVSRNPVFRPQLRIRFPNFQFADQQDTIRKRCAVTVDQSGVGHFSSSRAFRQLGRSNSAQRVMRRDRLHISPWKARAKIHFARLKH